MAIAAVVLLFHLLSSRRRAEACFVVVAGRDASSTGRVLIGHNEDNRGKLIMRHHYVKPEEGRGGLLSFEEGSARVPDVAPKLGFFWTETLRPAPGEPFGDSFVNERGVAIVSNSCCKSREDAPEIADGGIGWGLRWIVASRARSARDAVRIASDLVLTYGYRGFGRSYAFADAREAWLFQVVNGKHFAAQRLRDDHVLVNPNHYSIREMCLDEPNEFLASPGLIEYAIKRGWYVPGRRGRCDDFDFARAFQHPDYMMAPINTARHAFGLARAAGVKVDAGGRGARLPFSARPSEPLSINGLRETLSCHCERPEDFTELVGGQGEWRVNPHEGGGIMPDEIRRNVYTRICNGSNMESVIVDLHENCDETAVWSCFGNPCVLPMTPFYMGARSIPEYFAGPGPSEPVQGTDELIRLHFSASDADVDASAGEAWRLSRKLVLWCDQDYSRRVASIAGKVADLRREIAEPCEQGERRVEFGPGASKTAEVFFMKASERAGQFVEAMRSLTGEE
jgi:dipeptidase